MRFSPIEHEWLLAESMLYEIIKDNTPPYLHVHRKRPIFHYYPAKSKTAFNYKSRPIIADFIFVNEFGDAILFVFILPDSPWGAWHQYTDGFIQWLSEQNINYFWIGKQKNYSVGRAKHIVEQAFHMIRYNTGSIDIKYNIWNENHFLSQISTPEKEELESRKF
jgi:hypothetical protein